MLRRSNVDDELPALSITFDRIIASQRIQSSRLFPYVRLVYTGMAHAVAFSDEEKIKVTAFR